MVNDHPDIAGLFRNPDMLAFLGSTMAEPFRDGNITKVLAPEARGPILGALVAVQLGAGLVLARKQQSNHPGADIPIETAPTWRGQSEVFVGRSFDFDAQDRVVIIDDWITTGSTFYGARNLVQLLGATYVGGYALMNKSTPEVLSDLNVHTLVNFDDVMA